MKAYVRVSVGRGRSVWRVVENGENKGYIEVTEMSFTLFNTVDIKTNNPFVFISKNLNKIFKIANQNIR